MKNNILKLIKIAISIALLAYLVNRFGADNLLNTFTDVSILWILAAIAFMTVSNLLGAVQWSIILKKLDVGINFKRVLSYYYTGLFFNNFLLSFIGGDAVRVYDISKSSGKNSHALSTVFLDRFIGLVTISVFALVAAFLVVDIDNMKLVLLLVVALILLLSFIMVFLYNKPFAKKFESLAKKFVPRRFHDLMSDTYNSLGYYRQYPKLIGEVILISIFVQSFRILVHYAASRSLGLDISIIYFFLFIPIITIVILLPIVPGGIGLREWAGTELFKYVGVQQDAVVFELLAFFIAILCSTPGALTFVFRKHHDTEKI